MTTKEGMTVRVYDIVTADTLEDNDQIIVNGDPIELTSVLDEGDAILVKGYSHLTGDSVIHILAFDAEVELWTA